MGAVRLAEAADAPAAARLLHAFNCEFSSPSPGVDVLTDRLRRLLGVEGGLQVLLAGQPEIGLAVVSFRPNVWYAGPVALLDELYVAPSWRNRRMGEALLDEACAVARRRGAELLEINVDGDDVDARRFYERHGFVTQEPPMSEPAVYHFRSLAPLDDGDGPPSRAAALPTEQ